MEKPEPYKEVYEDADRYLDSRQRAESSSSVRNQIEWCQSASYWYFTMLNQYYYMVLDTLNGDELCEEYRKDGQLEFKL